MVGWGAVLGALNGNGRPRKSESLWLGTGVIV